MTNNITKHQLVYLYGNVKAHVKRKERDPEKIDPKARTIRRTIEDIRTNKRIEAEYGYLEEFDDEQTIR